MTPTPHCIVEIDGTRFDSWRGQDLISSCVELTTDKSGEGSVELFDPKFEILDKFFSAGAKVLTAQFWFGWEIDLGQSIFVGSLSRVEWGDRITTLRFHDHSAKMKKEKKTRYFKKQTDVQILKKLAADNGLKFSLNARIGESQPIDSLMQAARTDWEMALKIAERAGLKLYVKNDTLVAVEAGTTQLAGSVGTMIFEKDFTLLRGFNLTYKTPTDSRGRKNKTVVRGRGKAEKQITGTEQIVAGDTLDIVVKKDLPQQSVGFAQRGAKGKSNRKREYAFEHQLKTLSSFKKVLALRDTLTLAGMGKFFSRNYVITEIRHDFKPGQLISEITVGADLK